MSTPNFFAVIPATIRYDAELSGDEKMLYAEITALSNKEGFCWASNKYFATVFGVDKRTIQRRLNRLRIKGYITVVYAPSRRLYPVVGISHIVTRESEESPVTEGSIRGMGDT